jgi:hypothetical protein
LTVFQLVKGLKAQTNFIINRWAKTADGAWLTVKNGYESMIHQQTTGVIVFFFSLIYSIKNQRPNKLNSLKNIQTMCESQDYKKDNFQVKVYLFESGNTKTSFRMEYSRFFENSNTLPPLSSPLVLVPSFNVGTPGPFLI